MKIYFSGSIRGGREKAEVYNQIIQELKKYGEVLTEFIGDTSLTYKGNNLPPEEIYKRDVDLIKACDVVVAEVSVPSLGVGYEISYAESLNKPVLCLYKEVDGKSLSAMIQGNPGVKLYKYNNIVEVFDFLRKELDR